MDNILGIMRMSLVERFEKDSRIIMARTIEDFALIGQNGIQGAILKNPNILKPEDRQIVIDSVTFEEIEIFLSKTRLSSMPEFVHETGLLLFEAFARASRPIDIPYITARRNVQYPITPHKHDFTVIADIIGSTTIGFTDNDPSKPYLFPKYSIVAFEQVLHQAGAVEKPSLKRISPIEHIERLNFVLQ